LAIVVNPESSRGKSLSGKVGSEEDEGYYILRREFIGSAKVAPFSPDEGTCNMKKVSKIDRTGLIFADVNRISSFSARSVTRARASHCRR
jgi:hypothetical protein